MFFWVLNVFFFMNKLIFWYWNALFTDEKTFRLQCTSECAKSFFLLFCFSFLLPEKNDQPARVFFFLPPHRAYTCSMIWVDFRQHITVNWIQHFVLTYIRLAYQKASSILNAQNQGSFLAAMANGKGELLFKVFLPGSFFFFFLFFFDRKNDPPENEKQTFFSGLIWINYCVR